MSSIRNIKNKLFVPVILVVVIIGAVMLLNSDLEHIEDTNGTVSLVIAGESADFSFKMTSFDYDSFDHR